MEKRIIKTSMGYCGAACSQLGLAVLNLPVADILTARNRLDDSIKSLKFRTPVAQPEHIVDLDKLNQEITNYFQGIKTELNFPVDWRFYTPFQKKVLQRACNIPWGQLSSYGQLAEEIGSPRAARAVGGALGANSVLLVVPCHRVVANNGAWGGFGSGLNWKKKLIGLENL